jgi:ABC-type nitrate/sulfonate/bicarbonate transport system ATPase subunit
MVDPPAKGDATHLVVAFHDAVIGYRAGQPVLRVPHLALHSGERLGVVGRSGAGKSTLLRSLLDDSLRRAGRIEIDRPKLLRRGTGMVGQDQTLIPWKTARAHLTWAARSTSGSPDAQDPDKLLAAVGLAGASGGKFPDALSGGMRRRLMLAMALASRPSLLVLDEAFGSVDYFTKADLVSAVHNYCEEVGATLLLVSHDMREIVSLAERVACIDQAGVLAVTSFTSLAVGTPFVAECVSQEADRLFHTLSPLIGDEA